MLVRRREPRVERDRVVEGLECRGGDASQWRSVVKPRFTELKPHLGVTGVAAGGLLEGRKTHDN